MGFSNASFMFLLTERFLRRYSCAGLWVIFVPSLPGVVGDLRCNKLHPAYPRQSMTDAMSRLSLLPEGLDGDEICQLKFAFFGLCFHLASLAILTNRVCSGIQTNLMVAVGPLRFLAIMISAT